MKKIIFVNLAWLDTNYNTKDTNPDAGFGYVREGNIGYECFNFRKTNGKFYGYIGGIRKKLNIKRIEKTREKFVENVLVIFISRDTNDKKYKIVGYYDDAKVFANAQKSPHKLNGNIVKYFLETDKATVFDKKNRIDISDVWDYLRSFRMKLVGQTAISYTDFKDEPRIKALNTILYRLFRRDLLDLEVDDLMNLSDKDFEKYIKKTNNTPEKYKSIISAYKRSAEVKAITLRNAKGICHDCNQNGPFKYGKFYFLEVHHIIPLSKGGEDSVANTVALCPNCHRKRHHCK